MGAVIDDGPQQAVATAGPDPRAPAPALRVAFVGKGGAGKSSLAGTFTRLLARRTGKALLLDSDPMPGLAVSLGVERTDAGIPEEAVEEGPEDGPRYLLRWTAEDLVERTATHAPDGVRLLQVGKTSGGQLSQPALHAYQQLLDALVPGHAPAQTSRLQVRLGEEPTALGDWPVVGDLPGGTRQPFMGWGRFADTFLVVVEPTAKAVLAARRLSHLATGWSHGRDFRVVAVANKVRDDDDPLWLAEHTGLEVVAAVPWDPDVADAERAGLAPLDHAPDSTAVRALGSLVDELTTQEETP
jgi:CO dehydrogenase maturation factor